MECGRPQYAAEQDGIEMKFYLNDRYTMYVSSIFQCQGKSRFFKGIYFRKKER